MGRWGDGGNGWGRGGRGWGWGRKSGCWWSPWSWGWKTGHDKKSPKAVFINLSSIVDAPVMRRRRSRLPWLASPVFLYDQRPPFAACPTI